MSTSTQPVATPEITPAPAPAFPGFDTSIYPGDNKMQTWIDTSPYEFVAYYLTAPCHPAGTWMGHRANLIDMGWNLLPVYVGHQVAGVSPCKANTVTAAQGAADAQDASQKMASEGFAPGSYVYLDVERTETVPAALAAYITAWISKLSSDFRPGVYCHKHNAADVRAAALAGLQSPDIQPRFWIVGGSVDAFDLNTSNPTDVGVDFANLWQCPKSVTRTFGGVAINIDEDVADSADPAA